MNLNMKKSCVLFTAFLMCAITKAQADGPNEGPVTLSLGPAGGTSISGITNAIGYIPANANNGTVPNIITQYGAVGTGDDTTTFQSAINQSSNIFVPAGTYNVSTLFVTNNVKLIGYGATLSLIAGQSNKTLIDFSSNTNIQLEGLELDGLDYRDITTRTPTTNRIGIKVYAYGKNTKIKDVIIRGFDKGISFTGDATATTSHQKPHVKISSINCYSNWSGLYIVGGDSSHLVEYLRFYDLDLQFNSIGAYVDAGNIFFNGSSFTDNYYGILLGGSVVNNAHGIFNGCAISHNIDSAIFATNITTGFLFTGNQIRGGGNIRIDSCNALLFVGNAFTIDYVWGTSGTGTNYFYNNIYDGPFYEGGGPSGGWSFTYYATNWPHFGNYSQTIIGDSDRLYSRVNIPTSISTNFVQGFIYINPYDRPVKVIANIRLTTAAVAGDVTMDLQSPVGTLINRVGGQTLVTSLATTNEVNLVGFVGPGATYSITNTITSGAGNSVAVVGGQLITY